MWQNQTSRRFIKVLIAVGVLAGLYLASRYNYLLFHTLAEIFSLLIAAATFLLVLNFRPFNKDSFLFFIGSIYLFCGVIDLAHTLAYSGMNIFPGYDANLPTQLWIAARFMQSATLLAAPFLIGRQVNHGWIIGGFSAATIFLLVVIFAEGIFPTSYIAGVGLTPFKIISEMLIVALMGASVVVLWQRRAGLNRRMVSLLIASTLLAMLGELAFTVYVGVSDLSNLVGHYFRILALYLVYKAIIETFAQSIYVDMHKLIETERELRAAQASEQARLLELETLMDAVPAVVWVSHDRECRVVMGNRESYDLLHIPIGVNQSLSAPMGEAPQHFRVYQGGRVLGPDELPLQVSARDGVELHGFEEEIVFDDGEVRHLYGNVVPLYDPSGQPAGAVAAFVDISERKRTEAELKKYAARLERSNKDLEQFAFVASHDLHEPLRKVRAFGERLEQMLGDRLEETERDYLDRMLNASLRMQAMIDGLLAFSRVSTRGQPFENVDLGEVVADVVSDLELRIERTRGKVVVEKLPMITADELQMRQLFQNLIGNALKFHRPETPPLIEVSAEVRPRDGGGRPQTILKVRDNGIGFDMENRERIFLPFERLNGRGQFEGAGIGLAICQKIVERHGGSIQAESIPGVGSTFTITLGGGTPEAIERL